MTTDLAVFEGHKIRRHYDEKTDTWWFSVVDIIQVLIRQPNYKAAQNYWKVLKHRFKKEGSQLVTNCHQLKMTAADGKKYNTDVATAETLLRLVQSVPSPKAEPIKLWLAKVGYERMQEMTDPARALDRARQTWKKHGRSDKWIERRMAGQETRNKLTDYWAGHEVKKEDEFAILTNIIHQEWSELIFTALAELSTRQIAESVEAAGMEQNTAAARQGGGIAKKARRALEGKTGRKVVTGESFLPPPRDVKKLT